MNYYNHIIIGAGITGLSIAREIRKNEPDSKILVMEKEPDAAMHSSGRNSGILHSGFCHSSGTLKAQFTDDGNKALKTYCRSKNLPVNECGKLVVCSADHELDQLQELYQRGMRNGSVVRLLTPEEAREHDPNVKTNRQALYSPDTASIDPIAICHALKNDLSCMNVHFAFNCKYLHHQKQVVSTTSCDFYADKIINCAGLYAAKIANDFGFGMKYTVIPIKGIYIKYTRNDSDIQTNIAPVSILHNPFPGVHFIKTVEGHIKIGLRAMAFGKENYNGLYNFKTGEIPEILYWQALLFLSNSFNFRDIAFERIRRYRKKYFIELAQNLVHQIDPKGFTEYAAPGIDAQLLNKATKELVQDFVIESDEKSVHILNAVSPAFTCAFPFAEYVYRKHINHRQPMPQDRL
ncbi:MAG: FAD-dependent oxidoreductase [Candidatus Omnitrophota bacterium]